MKPFTIPKRTPASVLAAIEKIKEAARQETLNGMRKTTLCRPGYIEKVLIYAYFCVKNRKISTIEKDCGLPSKSLYAILQQGMEDNKPDRKSFILFHRYFWKFMNNTMVKIDRSIQKGIRKDYRFAHEVKKAIDPEYGRQKIDVQKTIDHTIKFVNCSNDELDKLIQENLKALPEGERASVIEMMKSKEGVYEPQTGNPPASGGETA